MSNTQVNSDQRVQSNTQISYNEIASRLLGDKYILTALELHSELVEAGRELRILRDFFSDPGNFNLQTNEAPSLMRNN